MLKRIFVKRFGPFHDRFRVSGKGMEIFLTDKGDKQRVFIDDDCAATAKSLD